MSAKRLLFVLLLPALFLSCGPNGQYKKLDAPVAQRVEKLLIMHGDTRIDFYYWMRHRENPDVIAYLEAENEYLASKMAHTEELQEALFQEMMARVKQDESSAPFYDYGFYYYTRFEEGGEYPIYCRRKGSLDAAEEIILNVPELAKNHVYFRVGDIAVSPDNNSLAFTVDTVGRRMHTIYIKDFYSGTISPTGIENAAGDVVWAADSETIFFTTIDPNTLRFDHVRKYNILTAQLPQVVYYETDETYYHMGVSKTKDGKYLVITCQSTVSNEIRILEADNPDGKFRVFEPRQPNLEYYIEHYNGNFYILTNYKAENFRLMKTPVDLTSRGNWREVVAHRPDVLIENFEVFYDFIVLQERANALPRLRIINTTSGAEHNINFEEEAFGAFININRVMDTEIFRYSYTSLTTPTTIYDYNMVTRQKTQVWQQTVLGNFSPQNYQTRRFFVEARDGAQVPVTLVHRADINLSHPNPLLQFGYGAYGINMNPWFNSNILSLLDRGFIYAIAHVRGGQEMGRPWYEDGKFLNKTNTFTDFIDVSQYLIDNKYTTPEELFAMGISAGGLLVGAVANMRPDLYKGIIAEVPFVDVVTTMLDETIPLTTSEYDEWGNPNDPVYYHYMLSYSPYDQIQRQAYPNMLITAGLHDSQVQFWEPAKWTAKLRHYNTGNNIILLQTNMEAGHGGATGRFIQLRETALKYSFIIDLLKQQEKE